MLLLRWSFDAAAFVPEQPLWDELPDEDLDEGLTLYATEDDPTYDAQFEDLQPDDTDADDIGLWPEFEDVLPLVVLEPDGDEVELEEHPGTWPEFEDFLQSADAGDESEPDVDDPTDFAWPEFDDFLGDQALTDDDEEPIIEGDAWSSPEPEDFIQPTPFSGDQFEDDETPNWALEDDWWFDSGNIENPPPPPPVTEVPHKHFLLSFGLLGGQWKH